MAKGRKPISSALRDNSKVRKTKAELEGERAVEELCEDIPNDLIPPDDIQGEGLKEWNKIVDMYKNTSIKILTNLDTAILRVHCDAVDRYMIAKRGWINGCKKQIAVKSGEDQDILDRFLKEMDRQGKVIKETSGALCLTIESRQRLAILNGKMAAEQNSDILKFMNDEEE